MDLVITTSKPNDGCIPNPGITIVTVSSDSHRGWDQACGGVLAIEDDGIDSTVVVVQSLADIRLRVVDHGSCYVGRPVRVVLITSLLVSSFREWSDQS